MALKRPAAAMAAAPRAASAAPVVKCLKRPAAAKAAPGGAKKEPKAMKDKSLRAERDGAPMKTVDPTKQIEEVTKLVTQQMSAQLHNDMKAVTALMTQNSEREDKIRSRHEVQMDKIAAKHAQERDELRKACEQERKTHEQDRKVHEQEMKKLQDKLNEANLKRGESDGRLEMLSTIYAEQQSQLALASSAAPPALLDAATDACASRIGASARTITAPKMRRHGRQAKAQETVAAPEAAEKQASQKDTVATPRSARKDAAASLSDVALFGEASENEGARNSARMVNKMTASQLKSSTPKAATTSVVSPGPPRSVPQRPQPSPIREAFFRSSSAAQSSKPGRPVGSLWGLKPVTPQLVEHA